MTQSTDNDDTITITLDDTTITLGDTSIAGRSYMDTIDTSDWTANESVTISGITTDTIDTIDISNIINIDSSWHLGDISTTTIDPEEVERMCKEYPALTKVWRNFKSVYDMVKQDYVGKKKAGEIDDDIPF